MYGFKTSDLYSLSSNPNIRVEVPKLKIQDLGVTQELTVNFKIMEETPGMNDPEVTLYENSVSLGSLDTTSISNFSFLIYGSFLFFFTYYIYIYLIFNLYIHL